MIVKYFFRVNQNVFVCFVVGICYYDIVWKFTCYSCIWNVMVLIQMVFFDFLVRYKCGKIGGMFILVYGLGCWEKVILKGMGIMNVSWMLLLVKGLVGFIIK